MQKSKEPSVFVAQMVVTLLRSCKSLHLLRFAFEAHAGATSGALNFEATCVSDNQGFASFSHAFSHP